MELLLIAVALVLVGLTVSFVHRHQQAVAWHRELEQAFGTSAQREIPRHRSL
jgi:hypothetical protein